MTVDEPPLRILGHADVLRAAADLDPVAVVRETLIHHAEGATTLPDEAYLPWHTEGGAFARSLALPGAVWGERPAIGLKMINSSLENPGRGLPRAQGLTFLFDPDTARPTAMMEAAWLSATRTAAYTVLSVRELAAPGVRRIGVLGCGALAAAHLRLLAAELPGAEVTVYDLDPDRARALADEWAGPASGLTVHPSTDPRSTVDGAGLVVCTTTTTTGYIAHDWLAPGALVAHVSLDDVLPEVIERADLLVVDDWDLIAADDRRILGRLYRSGEVTGPEGQHVDGTPEKGRRVDASLAGILAGTHPGRASSTDIVLSNPFGMGVLDVALAGAVRDVAEREDIGTLVRL
ncbi:ornithine cyclodeaminase [Pseudonocardia sp. C8]|uniref:ornithine cyclodeaminase n=1 Tax=Pseudonocardia sp. C8 TaxID=2762759 RepID=UPI001C92BD00